MSAKAEKSILEIAIELLEKKKKPQSIDTIIKEVMSLKGYKVSEAKEKAPQFVMDFMLSGNFIYCGDDCWDLKYRQPTSVLDKDGGDFEDFYANDEEVKQNELTDENTFGFDDPDVNVSTVDDDEEENNKEDEDDLSNEFEILVVWSLIVLGKYMNLKEVKEILEKYNAGALKKYGQNFLIDDNVLNIIASSLGKDNKYVIEIGPGLGSLTRFLVKNYELVMAYEIDPKMIEVLNDTIKEKLVIKEGDFLKQDVNKDIKEVFSNDNIYMIANLPYYNTTLIMLKVLEKIKNIKKIVIMIQKEVADRFLGKPNTKEYNSLSVLIQTYMNVKKVIDVSRNCFYPAPLVDSTVIMLERKEELEHYIYNEDEFLKINRNLFKQRRKTIVNNLKDIYNKEKIIQVLNKLNIDLLTRSEALTIKQIIEISNELCK